MISLPPRVRWSVPFCLVFVGLLAAGSGAVAEQVQDDSPPAAESDAAEAPAASDSAAKTIEPPPTPAAILAGLPKDLSALSRDELVGLIQDLTLQNQALFVRIARLETNLADAQPTLQTKIETQARTIERLRQKLDFQEKKHEEQREAYALARAAQPGADADDLPPGDAGEVGAEVPVPGVEEDGTPADPGEWEYRFAYEFGLIKTSGSGHVTLRDKDGNRQRQRFEYSEYRHDALWVNLFIRNDSPRPMRFTGLIALQDDLPLFAKHRPLLATKAFRTPLLQPGEVFQITEDEVNVDRPWKVENIELVEVRAYPDSPDPDPDPR